MELGARADEAAAKYSGGMRRRIEIARVLLHDPRCCCSTSPGAASIPRRCAGSGTSWALRGERAACIIVTTHQPEEAERCDRIAILDGGALRATGTPDELRARVAGDVVRVRGDAPEEIAALIAQRLGLAGRASPAARCIEAPRGHEIVPRIAELFAPGRLRQHRHRRPTLADVFAKLTGRG